MLLEQNRPASGTILVIHADDLGLSPSVNRASFAALDEGFVTSASVMVPCPSFAEVARFARDRPEFDLGVHITLTSEWSGYRWRPISPRQDVKSLVDIDGYFHADVRSFSNSVRLPDMKREIRAQIEAAVRSGLHPTHVDCHMYAVSSNSEIYTAFSEVAKEYSLPHILVTYRSATDVMTGKETISQTKPRILEIPPSADASEWEPMYCKLLASVRPGLSQLTVHVGFDGSELQEITRSHANWNGAWRQRDFNVLSGRCFRDRVAALGIRLTNWREIVQELE